MWAHEKPSGGFTELSYEVNGFMNHDTVDLTMGTLKDASVRPRNATVAVMCVEYKRNTSDARESLARAIVEEMSKRMKKVLVHDHKAEETCSPSGLFRVSPLNKMLTEDGCLVFVTRHSEFRAFPFETPCDHRTNAIVDTRNMFSIESVENFRLAYK